MTLEEIRQAQSNYRNGSVFVHHAVWRMVEWLLGYIEARERNDWIPRKPPLAGTAPDDEPEAA